jgi:Rrf2 family transcriptional repressor of oqxAB
MQALAADGIVESRGGREGGYILRKSAEQITLGEIYSAVQMESAEPEIDGHCEEAAGQLDVELEKILYEAEQQTIDYLRKYTIADVMKRVEFFNS